MDTATSAVVGISLASIIAHEAALSVSVERIVEILKGYCPFWPFLPFKAASAAPSTDRAATIESARCATLHLLSAVIGTTICWAGHLNFLHVAHVRGGYIAAGLMASAGSAFWNHILDIVKAAKVEKEHQARTALAQPMG